MTELKKHIYNDTNGLWYERKGDYYFPLLTLDTDDQRPIGKWGAMHRDYIKNHHPTLYNSLVLDGSLWTYLADLNERAQARLEITIKQTAIAEGVTEDLKAADQMAWVGAMNSIRSRAEEVILTELIYGEMTA